MKLHPYCALFPPMSDDSLRDLATDIRANGLNEPIVLLDGMILDGQNREHACRIARVKPTYVDFKKAHRGKDPLAFVVSRNFRRRDLTVSQRAMIANALVKVERERKTQAKAAESMDVSERTARSAKVVDDHGTDEEKAEVVAGKTTVSRTEKIIKGKIKDINEAAAADPERYGDLAERAKKPGAKIDPIHKELRKREATATKKGDVLKDRAGAIVPDHLKDHFGDPWMSQMAHAVEELFRDVLPHMLKTIQRKGEHYLHFMQSQATGACETAKRELMVLHGSLLHGRPHAVCPKCKGMSSEKASAPRCDPCDSAGWVPDWKYKELKKG